MPIQSKSAIAEHLYVGIRGCVLAIRKHDGSIAWSTKLVAPGGNTRAVFHFSAIITACSYGFGAWPLSIWYHRKWSTAFKGTFDAILYGLATGAVFMWMWPKA